MWTLKQTYLRESGKTALCSLLIYLESWKFISYPSKCVAFLHVQGLLLSSFPLSVDVSDSFSLVEAEKTHLAQSNMSQCMPYIPLSSQHSSLFLTVFLVPHRREHGGKMIVGCFVVVVKFVNWSPILLFLFCGFLCTTFKAGGHVLRRT